MRHRGRHVLHNGRVVGQTSAANVEMVQFLLCLRHGNPSIDGLLFEVEDPAARALQVSLMVPSAFAAQLQGSVSLPCDTTKSQLLSLTTTALQEGGYGEDSAAVIILRTVLGASDPCVGPPTAQIGPCHLPVFSPPGCTVTLTRVDDNLVLFYVYRSTSRPGGGQSVNW